MDPVHIFLTSLEPKARLKMISTMDRAQYLIDPRLFKKLIHEHWEFRALHARRHLRVLAFWDRRPASLPYVVATHGFIKKSSAVPLDQLNKSKLLKAEYDAQFH